MNIEEIDKWLDNEYGVSYTRLEELHDFVVDRDIEHQEQKDKVINDLLKRISNLEFDVEDKNRENERLNNIINKALGIANERVNHYYHINKKEILEDWEDIFNVLIERDNQELKGDDKEW